MGQFLPGDPSKGDANTLGGYMAVHARPAAFEGSDGFSYSVEVESDETGDPNEPWGGYLLFVRWSPGDPSPTGHLETSFLARGHSDREVRSRVGAMSLDDVKRALDALIEGAAPPAPPSRPWWEAMGGDEPRDGQG